MKPKSLTLESQFLLLVPLDEDAHSSKLYEALSGNQTDWSDAYDADEIIWKYLSKPAFTSPAEFQSQFVRASINDASRLPLAVIDKRFDRVIGTVSLMNQEEVHKSVKLGWTLIAPAYHGTFVRPQIISMLLHHFFETEKYRRVEMHCHSQNIASRRSAEKCGFKLETTFLRHMVQNQRSRDTLWFSVIDDEWPETRASLEKILASCTLDPHREVTARPTQPLSETLPSYVLKAAASATLDAIQNELVGEFVTLRRMVISDAPALLQTCDGSAQFGHGEYDAEKTWQYLPGRPPKSLEDMEKIIAPSIAGYQAYVVLDNASGRAIGSVSVLNHIPEHLRLELGYIWITPAFQGTTALPESVKLFLDMFRSLGYRRMEWKCNNNNIPSKTAAEKMGFVFEGVFRKHWIVKGENRDTAWLAMTGDEGFEIASKKLQELIAIRSQRKKSRPNEN